MHYSFSEFSDCCTEIKNLSKNLQFSILDDICLHILLHIISFSNLKWELGVAAWPDRMKSIKFTSSSPSSANTQ